ncbi:MAG TPA: YciI family protein [Azospirillaceae bacterium]|nr:YciI family protein [Azospirillaceae bacterium]
MKSYILLLREDPTRWEAMSPAEMQAVIQEYGAWAGKMAGQGRLEGGQKLTDEGGKRVRLEGGRLVVTDGPYAELKDHIGGFFVIRAADYDDACALLADCPAAKYGTVEVREVDPMAKPD